ncbi:MAG: tetraacyldisaccharide 4'-kinase [Kiritimatiellae bacterium]|nr:tetraacyldisaccharide 4'-kinase [Kiritimatiellia bacterium]
MWQNTLEKLENHVLAIIRNGGPQQPRGRGVAFLRWLLRQLSRLYGLVVQIRHFLYRKRIFRHHTLGCQVISIGNLTVGGTGKTPVVEVFARNLQKAGRRVAILSRGYKKVEPNLLERFLDTALLRERRRPPRVVSDGRTLLLDSAMSGDEPYMLASHLPDVAVLVDKNRVKSGRYAIGALGCDTLVLDDGFQYLALRHRLDIVLVDRTNPFGNRHVLPRGLLREPIRNIRKADVIFITKCDGSGTEDLKQQLRDLNAAAEIIECTHRAKHLQNVFSREHKELSFLDGRNVTALSGIAAPDGFEDELARRGARIVLRRRFADHHRYSQQEIIDLINASRGAEAEAIVTTEKDAVRFPKIDRWDVPIYFLRVEIELLSGTETFHECIARICFD